MTPEELFTAALGLGKQWRVAECRFEGEPKRLELRIEHVPGEHFECPHCKALCPIGPRVGLPFPDEDPHRTSALFGFPAKAKETLDASLSC